MRKIISCCLCLFLLANTALAEQPKVVVSASMIADMASRIAGEHLLIECIVPIGGDPHLHEPTPRDARLVSDADLVLINGLTFEGWLNELIENSGSKAPVVTVTEGIEPIGSLQYKNSADPHAWMDVSLAQFYIKNIKDAFIRLAPDQEAAFEANYQTYKKELEDLDTYIKQQIETIPAALRILITSHDAFQYYGRRYGIRLEAILGTSTDAEVQTSDIIRLSKVIKASQVPSVFVESTINPKLLQQLATDNGIGVGGKLYADSIGDEDSEASTYAAMMKYNTDTIVKALRKEKSVAEAAGKTTDELAGKESSSYALFGIIGVLLLGGFIFVYKKMNQ